VCPRVAFGDFEHKMEQLGSSGIVNFFLSNLPLNSKEFEVHSNIHTSDTWTINTGNEEQTPTLFKF
jgi:hypothetical protein